MKKENRFYVYEWFNKDTGEVFYVGKGTGGRWKAIAGRNQYFTNYHNKYNCDVRKIKDNMLENDAFKLEMDTIAKYRNVGQCKCNLTDGGEGASFPKGSWNNMYQRLNYYFNVKKAMDDMPNEKDYEYTNLKTKSLDELNNMYEEFAEFKDGLSTAYDLGLIKELDGYELKVVNQELEMLTHLLLSKIAEYDSRFKEFLDVRNTIDIMCVDFDVNSFLQGLFELNDYYLELVNTVLYIMRFMKYLNVHPNINTDIKIHGFNIEGRYINVKFSTVENKKYQRVKVDLYDTVWDMICFKNKALFQILYNEIRVAEIL